LLPLLVDKIVKRPSDLARELPEESELARKPRRCVFLDVVLSTLTEELKLIFD
jgi:hypothetical protein